MAAGDVTIRRVIVNPRGLDVHGEAVFLHNGGEEDVDLTGWRLSDTLNHPGPTFTFDFPAFSLLAGSGVAIHTGEGANDGQHLFWGRDEAVWNNAGDRVVLLDGAGVEIDSVTWAAEPPLGRVIDTDVIAREIAEAAAAGPPEALPSGPIRWTLGPTGEVFWQEVGDQGAAFHAGYPDSIWSGAAVPETPVIYVSQSIYQKYRELGGPQVLGRPLTRRQDVAVADPGRQVFRQDFDGGSIFRSAATGAHLVKGAIRDRWLSPEGGGPAGRMGLPISGERTDGDLVYTDFERGSIFFTPEEGAQIVVGIVVDFVGFHCLEATFPAADSDEVYFAVQAAPLNPPTEAVPRAEDGMWSTALPAEGPIYTEVDSGDVVSDQHPVYIGRAVPLVVKVLLWERDEGDANALRAEIQTAVAATGAIVAAFIPAASVVATNPQVQATVTNIINRIADTDDEFIGRNQFVLPSRREILNTLRTPPHDEVGVPIHHKVFLTDDDGSYDALFRVRLWEPD